jgi:hypothetical protein
VVAVAASVQQAHAAMVVAEAAATEQCLVIQSQLQAVPIQVAAAVAALRVMLGAL